MSPCPTASPPSDAAPAKRSSPAPSFDSPPPASVSAAKVTLVPAATSTAAAPPLMSSTPPLTVRSAPPNASEPTFCMAPCSEIVCAPGTALVKTADAPTPPARTPSRQFEALPQSADRAVPVHRPSAVVLSGPAAST